MHIEPLDGWDNPGQHDSKLQPRDLAYLIGQAKSLPGIATQDYKNVPSMIKLFAEKCLYGDRTIYVVKGLHQRWGKNPKPHLRVRFFYTMGPNLTNTSIDMHIELSEDPTGRKVNGYDAYTWKTVGISYVIKEDVKATWPAVYSQEVGNIQKDGRRGYKRRWSVGCFPPPEQPAQQGQE